MSDEPEAEDTELRRVQLELRAQRGLAERVISSSRDGILAFDLEFRYTLWNASMEEISGVKAPDVLGRCAFEAFPFLKEIGEDHYFHAALRGEHTVARDRPFEVPSTGRKGFFEGYYGPLHDGQGHLIGGLAVVRDVTERKLAADAMRTAQLQVAHESKLASMGRLGAGIAHELNQPLTGLKMLLSLIRERPHLPVAASLANLDLALEQVDRMARIVDNVRGFARRGEFTPAPTPARGALDDALALLGEQIRLEAVELTLDLPADLPPIAGDRMRLQQVFLNLLSNALHALEDAQQAAQEAGGAFQKRLEITARRVQDEVMFRVCDNGPGVPEAALGQLFDPFFTTKRAGRGTGLGLSLAFGIAEEHGGSLAYELAELAEGSGACFVLRVPVALAEVEAEASNAETPVERPTPKLQVLVLDDERALRSVLGSCLARLGCEHALTSSAEEAEAELARRRFDLALVDLRMPGRDGVDVCAQLRRDYPELRVVAMSGFVTQDARERLETLGVDTILAKPFDLSSLGRLIKGE